MFLSYLLKTLSCRFILSTYVSTIVMIRDSSKSCARVARMLKSWDSIAKGCGCIVQRRDNVSLIARTEEGRRLFRQSHVGGQRRSHKYNITKAHGKKMNFDPNTFTVYDFTGRFSAGVQSD